MVKLSSPVVGLTASLQQSNKLRSAPVVCRGSSGTVQMLMTTLRYLYDLVESLIETQDHAPMRA